MPNNTKKSYKNSIYNANAMDITFPYASQSSIVRSVQFDEYYQDYLTNETKNLFKQIFGKLSYFYNYKIKLFFIKKYYM